MFELNERIKQDSLLIKNLKLCELRLIKDGELTWFLLVPTIPNISELTELSVKDQHQLLSEVNQVVARVSRTLTYDKVNFASLGNIVSQLHFHIIFRLKSDRAWPGAVWGTKSDKEFNPAIAEKWKDLFYE